MPLLGLGTSALGENKKISDQVYIRKFEYALDIGYKLIDTARIYAGGNSESLIGLSVKRRQNREKLFLITKATGNIDEKGLLSSIKSSLNALDTDYVDLFLIHTPNHDIPLKKTVKGIQKILQNNLTKYVGVSNFRLNDLKKIIKMADFPIVVNQFHYNLLIREAEVFNILNFCQNENIVLSAYQPLQRGHLSKVGNKLLDDLARKYRKTQEQIALNWLIQNRQVNIIVQTYDRQRLIENISAITGWTLSYKDFLLLKNNFPLTINYSDCMPPDTREN